MFYRCIDFNWFKLKSIFCRIPKNNASLLPKSSPSSTVVFATTSAFASFLHKLH